MELAAQCTERVSEHGLISNLYKSLQMFVFQSLTLLLPMTSACSPTSSSVRTRWNMTVGKQCILVWQGFAKMISEGDFCWRTHGQLSWRPDWTAPELEKSLSITMNCKAPSTFPSKIWSTVSSLLMCELHWLYCPSSIPSSLRLTMYWFLRQSEQSFLRDRLVNVKE